MPSSRPLLCLLSAVLAVAALVTPSADRHGQPLALAAAQQVYSGQDFATSTWQDPWDYSNSADLLLDDNGPAWGLSNAVMANGVASFSIAGGAYVSPLWGGYDGSLHLGRDGALPANTLNATTYARLHLHAYASAPVSAALQWFSCSTVRASCMGGMPFGLRQGWNDIDLAIANNPRMIAHGAPWSAAIHGVRLAMTARSAAIKLDFLRIYQPDSASTLSWTSPDSARASLWWSDNSAPLTPVAGQHGGPVTDSGTATGGGDRQVTNVAGYPPSTRFWALSASGAQTYVGQTAAVPLPVIDSPSAAGCADYLGRPWTFPSPRSLAGYANATALAFSRTGELSATNAGPQRNDPHIFLPLGPGGINGRVYHRLTIVESYDGPFNLKNAPGGGTMGRVMWRTAGHTALSQTNDILTYGGVQTITIDLATPVATLTEPDGSPAQRYAFAATAPVLQLRWDPNEDPGARRWHVFSVRLAADCSTRTSFAMTWHDAGWMPGSRAAIQAVGANGATTTLADVSESAGTNSFAVRAAGLPAGSYTLRTLVTNPAGVSTAARSSGPLVISH